MKSTARVYGPTECDNHGSWQEWQFGVQLLQQMQTDYQQAKKQFEGICSLFGERENAARAQLELALDSLQQIKCQPSESAVTYLRVYCLGSFDVHVDNSRVDRWSSLKAKSIF